MSEEFDVGVVGGGIIGLMTAWKLVDSCRSVILFEQNKLGFSQGSSRGSSRMFGETFSRDIYFQLARRSRTIWQNLEREMNKNLLHLMGGLDIIEGKNAKNEIKNLASILRQRKSQFEILDAKSLMSRYSQFRAGLNTEAIYSPDSGILMAEECISAAISKIKKLKVGIKEDARVKKISRLNSKSVSVNLLTGESYQLQNLVIAGGPWMPNILGSLGVNLPLKLSQEQVVYFVPHRNWSFFTQDKFPVWEWDGKDFVYGFPIFEKNGIKIAFHQDGRLLKGMRDFRKTPSSEVTDRLGMFLNKHIPDAAGESFDEMTCVYTNTPDNDFIVDVVPGMENISFFTGDSGHAFHCAPAIGEILAELSTCGKTTLDIRSFRVGRFF